MNINPIWAAHIKKAEQELKFGKVTAIKSGDVWKTVSNTNKNIFLIAKNSAGHI